MQILLLGIFFHSPNVGFSNLNINLVIYQFILNYQNGQKGAYPNLLQDQKRPDINKDYVFIKKMKNMYSYVYIMCSDDECVIGIVFMEKFDDNKTFLISFQNRKKKLNVHFLSSQLFPG